MGQFSKSWDELTFSDNYIFCKVMQDEALCSRMIEILLGIQVGSIQYLNTEQQIESHYDARGIRLDVCVKDSERIFDIEIQTGNYSDLLLRSRYYQSASDVATVKRRTKFHDLKESFILFICKDDPFGAGIPVYTRLGRFVETDAVAYDDKTHAVFYNASAWNKVSDDSELRAVLRFIYEAEPYSEYTEQLNASSKNAKARSEWEDDYMYFQDILEEEKELAREEGLSKGREAGREIGLAEGRAEGLSEGRLAGAHDNALSNARNLLKMNILTIAQISQATGLSLEEVQGLA